MSTKVPSDMPVQFGPVAISDKFILMGLDTTANQYYTARYRLGVSGAKPGLLMVSAGYDAPTSGATLKDGTPQSTQILVFNSMIQGLTQSLTVLFGGAAPIETPADSNPGFLACSDGSVGLFKSSDTSDPITITLKNTTLQKGELFYGELFNMFDPTGVELTHVCCATNNKNAFGGLKDDTVTTNKLKLDLFLAPYGADVTASLYNNGACTDVTTAGSIFKDISDYINGKTKSSSCDPVSDTSKFCYFYGSGCKLYQPPPPGSGGGGGSGITQKKAFLIVAGVAYFIGLIILFLIIHHKKTKT